MTYFPHANAQVLNGSYKRANRTWIYSDGTYVTAQGTTLSAGWHEALQGSGIYEYQDWDPANGPPPLNPPPPTVRNWLLAWDNAVPTISPGSPTIAATDFSFVNPNPVTARAGWSYAGSPKQNWNVVVEFWSEENGLVEALTVSVASNITSVESDAVYSKDETIYCIVRYRSDGGSGPGAESAHLAYPGSAS